MSVQKKKQEKKNRPDILNLIRYGIAAAAVVYIGVLLALWGNSSTPFDQVEAAVEETMDVSTLKKGSSQELKRFYGFSESDCDSVCLYVPEESMAVEEMLLVKTKNGSGTESIREAMESRRDTQIQNYEGYGPEQVKLLEESVIKEKGDYIIYIVSPNAQSVANAFTDVL